MRLERSGISRVIGRAIAFKMFTLKFPPGGFFFTPFHAGDLEE